MGRSAATALAGVVLTGVLAACSPGSGGVAELSGQRAEVEQATSTESDSLFDPCEDIPAEAIEEAGFDPGQQKRSEYGDDVHLICGYRGEVRGHSLSIHATRDQFEDKLEANLRLSDTANITPIEVDGRRASLEQLKADNSTCEVLIEVPFGSLIVQQSNPLDKVGGPVSDPALICDQVQKSAEILLRYVPRGSG